ncbi:MAG: DUF1330 domain-containing protein [Rhizobiaceae bacterium]|nr:DUF1330 domain-containing protein [Rhizobiaceae bacterium]
MSKKGYWMAHVEVHDPERYKLYIEGATPAYEEYGAKFLVRGGKSESPEGNGFSRNVVIEFESYDQALACYNSPAYTAAREHRIAASNGQITIVEGH